MSPRTLERATRTEVRIEPRIAERRRAVASEQRRRRGVVVLAVLVVLAAFAALFALTRSPLLDVDRIEYRGLGVVSEETIAEASRIHVGEPLTSVDAAASARRIEAIPVIATAQVRRDWNGLVVISVTERTPLALMTTSEGELVTVDATGRVLAPAILLDAGLVRIAGPVAGEPGSWVDGASGALELAGLLTPGVRSRVVGMTVADDGSLTMALRPQGVVEFGPPSDLRAKVAALTIVMGQVDQRDLGRIRVINPDTPVVTRGPNP